MRESRTSGSVEGVVCEDRSYSNSDFRKDRGAELIRGA